MRKSIREKGDAADVESGAVKVLVLGTAQDGGVPHVACRCPRCEQAREHPSWSRKVASLGIIDGASGRIFLVDATPDLREQLDRLQRDPDCPVRPDKAPLDGVLLTHAHVGHYTGLIHFGREILSTANLPVYCTPGMGHFLKSNSPWNQLLALGQIVLRDFLPEEPFKLGEGTIVNALRVPHRDELSDTVGFRIEGPRKSLLYIPDIDSWAKWNKSILDLILETDSVLIDGTFYSGEELPRQGSREVPHPPMKETMSLLGGAVREGDCKVYFTHFNHSNPVLDKDRKIRREVEEKGFLVADEGMEFLL